MGQTQPLLREDPAIPFNQIPKRLLYYMPNPLEVREIRVYTAPLYAAMVELLICSPVVLIVIMGERTVSQVFSGSVIAALNT